MNRPTAGGRRVVDGILLLDKPTGMTSNAALQVVKRLFRARKAGHTGSLDPLASGLLPICFGEATKLSHFLLDADKRYAVRARLGVTTDSGDADGRVLETRPVPPLDRDAVERVLSRFRGVQSQIPPMYSALKHQGERLYNLARQGVEVEREPREITIHGLGLTGLGDGALELDVHCSKGTYVRTLVEDIGREMGCGAHVEALRRTAAGPFRGEQMVPLEALEARREDPEALLGMLLAPDQAVQHWPAVALGRDAAFYLRQGQAVLVPRAPTAGPVRLYDDAGGFMGMGEIADDGRVAPRRLLQLAAQ